MHIFNFHHVEPKPAQKSRANITISPSGLRQIIHVLRSLGFRIVSLSDVLQEGVDAFPPRTAVFTFDDGYENFYRHGLPVLREEQCPATVFVLAQRFAGTNVWDQAHLPADERDKLMSEEQLHDMGQGGLIHIGSHGLLHRKLATVATADLIDELEQSYDILSETFRESFLPVFAYPWGDHSEAVLAQMDQSRYQFALTTQTGPWEPDSPRYKVLRYSIYDRDRYLPIFIAKLWRHGILR